MEKTLELHDHCLSKTGLDLQYAENGEDKEVELNREEAAKLLKKAGIINDYAGYGDDIDVTFPYVVGEPGDEEEKLATGEWEWFVLNFNLRRSDAIKVLINNN